MCHGLVRSFELCAFDAEKLNVGLEEFGLCSELKDNLHRGGPVPEFLKR